MSSLGFCKILIVDDEILIRQGIKHYINWENEGFQIVGEAANGIEALEMIDKLHPHIVITDIVMPVMDGEELTKVLKRDYPNIEVIVLSSYGDFDYVRSSFQSGAIDYILKPKMESAELLKVLRKAADKAGIPLPDTNNHEQITTEQLLEKLMTGYDIHLNDKQKAAIFPTNHFCLLAVSFQSQKNLFSQINRRLSDELGKNTKFISVFPLSINNTNSTMLLNYEAQDEPIIIQQIATLSGRYPDLSWMIGNPFTDMKDMKAKSEQLIAKMKQYLFYFPETVLLCEHELPHDAGRKEIFNLNHFINVFKQEKFAESFQYLRSYLDQISYPCTLDEFECKSFLGNIIFNISVLLGNMKYDNQELEKNKYYYFSGINDARSAGEAFHLFQQFLKETENVIETNRKKKSNIQALLDFIESHYNQPLTLTEMANHFHFHPTYLSSYFNAHHREGFSEYLNRVRIEKSLAFLQDDTLKISEISGMIGYSDQSYFCKVFKKMMGMSPSTYRKQYLKRSWDAYETDDRSNPKKQSVF
ncbi:response regulator transcription factor [Bacillaceae bacterium Marseille-Q3522]|nr:response regulator transcription factor [Bacillaceae bacterium Marseille-Q3522]